MRTASPNDDLAAPWETRPLVLIGRDAELGRVERALETARGGGSDVLVLRGQPGIGKTALLRAAIERAGGMTVLRTRGLEGEAELPFAGLAELCEPVLELRDRLPAAQAAALEGALAARAGRSAGAAGDRRRAARAALARRRGAAGAVRGRRPPVARRAVARGAALRRPAARCGRRRPCCSPSGRERDVAPASRRWSSARSPPSARSSCCRRAARTPVPDLVARRVLDDRRRQPARAARDPRAAQPRRARGPRAASRGRCRPARRSSACSRAGSTALGEDTRRALLVAAAAEARRGDVVLGALAAAGHRRGRARERRERRDRHARRRARSRFRHPLLRAAAYHGATAVARRDAHRAVARALPEDDPQRAWQLAAGATRPDETVAAALEARRPAARAARTGFGPAAHAHLRAAELSPDPLQRARRLVEAARDLLPAGHPDVGLARLEQAERVLAIAEGSDVSAVATELRTLRAQLALRTGRTDEARELLRAQARRLRGRGAADGGDAAAALVARRDGAARPPRLAGRRRAGARAGRRRRAAGRARDAVGRRGAHDGARRRHRAAVARGGRAPARRPRAGAVAGARDRGAGRPRLAVDRGVRARRADARPAGGGRPRVLLGRRPPLPARRTRAGQPRPRPLPAARSPTPRRRWRSPSRRARTRRW